MNKNKRVIITVTDEWINDMLDKCVLSWETQFDYELFKRMVAEIPATIQVPALVWEVANFGAIGARTPFGEYVIVPVEKEFVCEFGNDDDYSETYPTCADAKSACQADYERRLYEALTQNGKESKQ